VRTLDLAAYKVACEGGRARAQRRQSAQCPALSESCRGSESRATHRHLLSRAESLTESEDLETPSEGGGDRVRLLHAVFHCELSVSAAAGVPEAECAGAWCDRIVVPCMCMRVYEPYIKPLLL